MFKVNVGPLDRVFRVALGLFIIFMGFIYFGIYGSSVQLVSILLGGVLVFTGIVGYCGIYALLGISTCPAKIHVAVKTEKVESVKKNKKSKQQGKKKKR